MDDWALLTAITFGLTVADIELTQACLRTHACKEGNPLVPEGRAKIYAIQMPITAGISYLGWRLRKGKARYWWFPQVALSAGHGVGVGFGLRFQF